MLYNLQLIEFQLVIKSMEKESYIFLAKSVKFSMVKSFSSMAPSLSKILGDIKMLPSRYWPKHKYPTLVSSPLMNQIETL